MRFVAYLIWSLLLLSYTSVMAEPKEKVFNESYYHKNKTLRSSKDQLDQLFGLKTHGLDSVALIRGLLIESAFHNIQIPWYIENQGKEFVDFRWDYGKDFILVRIEFNAKHYQINHLYSIDGTSCSSHHNGICYSAGSNYFKYLSRLESNIRQTIAFHKKGRHL